MSESRKEQPPYSDVAEEKPKVDIILAWPVSIASLNSVVINFWAASPHFNLAQ
jgi:hypothetical protein